MTITTYTQNTNPPNCNIKVAHSASCVLDLPMLGATLLTFCAYVATLILERWQSYPRLLPAVYATNFTLDLPNFCAYPANFVVEFRQPCAITLARLPSIAANPIRIPW